MNFNSFTANDDIKQALSAAVISGRLPHALILQGEDGLGKRTLAKLIAAALVCTSDKSESPCGACPACIRAKAGSHPDIRIITGSGVSNTISVDSVKEMTEDAYRKPEESDYNVYLIFVEGKMSEAAQNKLLKIIEEPPAGAVFIMTIKSADSLLPTIRSRAAIFTLHVPDRDTAAEYAAGVTGAELEKAQEASQLYGGNIGKMLAYLSGEKSAVAQQTASAAARLVDSSDENELLSVTAVLIKDKAMFSEVTDLMAAIFRDACVLRAGGTHLIGTDPQAARQLSLSQTKARLFLLPDICVRFKSYCERNANMKLLVTNFCAALRTAINK
jgi:DNA polymerase III delta' subunit